MADVDSQTQTATAYPDSMIYETATEVDLSLPLDNLSPQLIRLAASPLPSQKYKARLLNQAPEVLHNIFQNVQPTDLACLLQTCRHLNSFVKNDELLWKLQYLALFDPPNEDDFTSWRAKLTRLISLQKILESDNEEVKMPALEEVLSQTIKLANQSISSSFKTTDFLSSLFRRGPNINKFLCQSSLFARVRPSQWSSAGSEPLRQLSAQLHVLAGMNIDSPWPSHSSASCPHSVHDGTMEEEPDDPSDDYSDPGISSDGERISFRAHDTNALLQLRNHPTPIHDVHPWARSRVYDLRRYKESNMWGPFTDDGSGRIDWEKVQAIMVDLAFNHRKYTEQRATVGARSITSSVSHSRADRPMFTRSSGSAATPARDSLLHAWENLFEGIAPNSYVSTHLTGKLKPSPHPDLDALDPYGVTGTWMRIVCFLDYNDLYRFNFEHAMNIPDDQERGPITTREAFRLIRLQLHVTRVEEQEGVDQHGKPLLPIVHFEGISKSTYMAWDPNANSSMRGSVHATPTGCIRWTSFSIFHGEERWRSEGVQIGGLRSARGILGNWFDKDYDAHGPAGPTAFWKISDEMVEEKRRDVPNMMQLLMAD